MIVMQCYGLSCTVQDIARHCCVIITFVIKSMSTEYLVIWFALFMMCAFMTRTDDVFCNLSTGCSLV